MNCRFLIDKRYTGYSGNQEMCNKITGLYSNLNHQSFLDNLNGNSIKPHIVLHIDHSGPQSMGAASKVENQSIGNPDVDQLTNGKYYQIIMTNGCHPGNFAVDCIGEHFLFHPQGGAVAFLGNTDAGPNWYDNLPGDFIENIYKSKAPQLGTCFKSVFDKNKYSWAMHLLGDPEMPIWTSAPKQMNITATIQKSTNKTYLLTINGSNIDSTATICISKAKDLYYVGTLKNGASQYYLTPYTSGKVSVVITAPNYRPFQQELDVTTYVANRVEVSKVTVDDSANGNNDKKVDAGETINLKIKMWNKESAIGMNGLKATVTCNSPFIRLNSNQISWGNFSGNAEHEGSFSFTVDKNAAELLQSAPDAATFHLAVSDANGVEYYVDDLKIDILQAEMNAELAEMSQKPTAGNPITLKFRISNSRIGEATGLQASLTGSYLTTATQACGSLAFKQDSIYTFSTRIASNYTGGTLPVTLTLTNRYGRTWTQTFNLGNAPAVIPASTMDYTCDARWIQVYWTPRSGVKGYNVYRSNVNANGEATGTYRKQNKDLLNFAFYNDDQVEEFSSYLYKVSVVSNDGMESALSEPVRGGTSFKKIGLFPVTAYNASHKANVVSSRIDSPVITEDINGDGKKEIFTSLQNFSGWGALIGINSNGDDLFDIDNNVTTHSGFAETIEEMCVAPAIGPLVMNGEKHIICAERGQGNSSYVYCYAFKDQNKDGKPDLVWKTLVPASFQSSLILANVDGSKDGSNEIILRGEQDGANPKIYILSNQGKLLYSFGDGGTYSGLAVADLDGNGTLEIIAGYGNGTVRAYTYWGSLYKELINIPGRSFTSTPTVGDIDNDGKKEILIMGKSGSQTYVYVRKADASKVTGWNDLSQTSECNTSIVSQDIALGDLNKDGKPEIVVSGKDYIKIWKNDGSLLKSIYINGLRQQYSPILADVDGDHEAEIIVCNFNKVFAYNPDGSRVMGFPLITPDEIFGIPCVADIDDDGINEIIVPGRNSLCAWETDGNPNAVEWGTGHHDVRNTNEYTEANPGNKLSLAGLHGEDLSTPTDLCSGDAVSMKIVNSNLLGANVSVDWNYSWSFALQNLTKDKGVVNASFSSNSVSDNHSYIEAKINGEHWQKTLRTDFNITALPLSLGLFEARMNEQYWVLGLVIPADYPRSQLNTEWVLPSNWHIVSTTDSTCIFMKEPNAPAPPAPLPFAMISNHCGATMTTPVPAPRLLARYLEGIELPEESELPESKIIRINLYTQPGGVKVFSKDMDQDTFDLYSTGLPPGIYIMEILREDGTRTSQNVLLQNGR